MKHLGFAFVFIFAALSGCTVVDKAALFNTLGEPDKIPIEGRSKNEVFSAVVKVADKYFDGGTENWSYGVVYTGFMKNANSQKYPDITETYMRKCVADVTEISATEVELRLQVAAFKIQDTSIVPTGFRDSALHEAVKQQILDELGSNK
jgi:hypothetical protein